MLESLSNFSHYKLNESDIELLSPITKPCRILCQGSNYPQSRIETGMKPYDKNFNTIFHKSDASLAKPDTDIIKPEHVQLLDYEIELGIVIGAEINDPIEVTPSNIGDYVAGVVMAHDVTARDIQIPQVQFFKGKSYRTFCPTGPYLCLLNKDEMHYLSKFHLSLSVNDEERQSDHSRNLIYSPHETLTELSQISDLAPGDLLLTGSPGGGALSVPSGAIIKLMGLLPDHVKWKAFVRRQSKNPAYLKSGDRVKATIQSVDGKINLGTQNNIVIAE
jgi:2-keto-4-pentenoate hydratase/2-oxohepta-3-ene-1,7-dioic acid hydratase in catechol pathway